ncbi:MAG: hypothetical protein M0R33_12075 [Methylomonas sp.]|jgi:glucan phosphoethanolaminetransferase (alkaline phosphatase superfamily)|uniref:hypothetical protein n=1 Tax=Methylomonas sp. TaxID=418 RepID=UPI0025DC8DA5|nr:hypothetical protein [Methylomonas sp.]MCK9607172.1 hypothetical protein [Methylomonas sp.]
MLVEPVALSDFFLSFFSAAMIILTAVVYTALYTWAKIKTHTGFYLGAWLAYATLLICVGIFSVVNHFTGYWLLLSLTMAVGYAFMPQFIWRLCVATHADESEHSHQSGGHHD